MTSQSALRRSQHLRRARGCAVMACGYWVASALAPVATSAQQQSCERRCTIAAVRVAELRVPIPETHPLPSVASDHKGRIYIAPREGVPVVVDTSGKVIRQLEALESREQLRTTTALLTDSAGNVELFDGAARKRHVIAPDGAVLRTSASPYAVQRAVRTRDGRLIVNAVLMDEEYIGMPFHELTADGTIRHSFGDAGGVFRISDAAGLSRILVPSRSLHFWAARSADLSLELWSADGNRVKRIAIDSSWIRDNTTGRDLADSVRPRIWISALREDGNGRLWVAVLVSRQPPPTGARALASSTLASRRSTPVEREYDTVLLVLDPATESVIARARVPAQFTALTDMNRGIAYVMRDRRWILEMWRVALDAHQ